MMPEEWIDIKDNLTGKKLCLVHIIGNNYLVCELDKPPRTIHQRSVRKTIREWMKQAKQTS